MGWFCSVGMIAAAALWTPCQSVRAEVLFNRDIRPILAEHCFACHGPDDKTRQADLRLDLPESATAPRKAGQAAVTPGKPQASEMIRRMLSDDPGERMPPLEVAKRPTAAQIDLLQQWIAQGAPYEGHWAFIPPRRDIELPAVDGDDWPRNEVDRFILAKLRQEKLSPAPQADRTTLIRRASLDLTGLPPTLEEVDAFLNDSSADAYEKVVDRLLSSQAYGERMAVYWLDLARFADSDGYHDDTARSMWQYRDYVIQAFNRNKPFDRFTIEQLAGDQLPGATLEQKIASAFHRNGPTSSEGGADALEYAAKYAVDRVNTTAEVWLGVTMHCAECHDHKYDPFTTKEYYQLFAFFNQVPEDPLIRTVHAPPAIRTPTPEQQEQLTLLTHADEAAREALETALRTPREDWDAAQRAWETTFTAADVDVSTEEAKKDEKRQAMAAIAAVAPAERNQEQTLALRAYFREREIDEVKSLRAVYDAAAKARRDFENAIPMLRVMATVPEPRPTYILVRGDYRTHGEQVYPAVPAVLGRLPEGIEGDRLALATWLTAEDHPLTARVMVNRLWQLVFGVGIVKTAEDFGSRGDWPSHPELLDYLAVRFIESGWDVKAMMRLLVTSAAYRQDSSVSAELLKRDPQNRLLARGPRFRLAGEFIRDNALAISGLFDRDRPVGGPSVKPYQPGDLWREMSYGDSPDKSYIPSTGPDLYRRGLYTFWKRSIHYPSFAAFDAPNREVCTVTRPITNTPLQAFVTLNDVTFVEAARVFAQRILVEGGPTFDQRLDFAWRTAMARPPLEGERDAMRRLYETMHEHYAVDTDAALALLSAGESARDESLDPAQHAAWAAVCNAILNLDEVITKE